MKGVRVSLTSTDTAVKCGICVVVLPSVVDYFLIPFILYVGQEPFYYPEYCNRVIEAG